MRFRLTLEVTRRRPRRDRAEAMAERDVSIDGTLVEHSGAPTVIGFTAVPGSTVPEPEYRGPGVTR